MSTPEEIAKKVDGTDRKILNLLIENSRVSITEIAKQVHLSRVAVRERIKRMEESNIIQQYTAVVDSSALGYGVAAFLEIEVLPQHLEEVAQELIKKKDISIVYQMTGPSILHVHVFAKDNNKLSAYLKDEIYCIQGILKVSTYLLLKGYKATLFLK